MYSHFSTLIFFGQLLLILVITKCEVRYYITPSQNVPCPQDPCFTLSQYAASNLGNEINISIYFLPGNHRLDRKLFLLKIHSVVMTTAEQLNYGNTVFIQCSNHSGKFIINETMFASISSLYFIGCGGNLLIQVEQFIIKDSTFVAVDGRFTDSILLLFNVSSAKIVNVSFHSNAYSSSLDYYGVIYAVTSSFNVTHCDFTDIYTGAVGLGMIYASKSYFNFINNIVNNCTGAIIASQSWFSISNSTFTNSFANAGRVIYTNRCLFHVNNCTFADNTAHLDGAVIVARGSTFAISNSIFTDNLASHYRSGGVVYAIQSSLMITGSTFDNNSASRSGGVICAKDSFSQESKNAGVTNSMANLSLSIFNCSFTNNSASRGGIIAIFSTQSPLNIINSTINSNTAQLYGGILFLSGSIANIINCTIMNNGAYVGGVIYTAKVKFVHYSVESTTVPANSSIYMINTNVTNNSAENRGGIIAANDELSFIFIKCIINNNKASYYGGVLFLSGSLAVIINCIVGNNNAHDGGVIHTTEITVPYHNNKISISNFSSVNIIDTNFTNNSAKRYGGVIMISTFDETPFNIIKCTININKAYKGGVIYAISSLFNILETIFVSNTAAVGGAIASSNSSFDIYKGTFIHNSASGSGAVVYMQLGSSSTIIASTFSSNKAGGYGGVICAILSSLTTMGNIFDNNGASHFGGVIYDNSIECLQVTRDEVIIYSVANLSLSIFNCSFINNRALSGGVIGVVSTRSPLRIINCTFDRNTALNGGGVLFSSGPLADIINCAFRNNNA